MRVPIRLVAVCAGMAVLASGCGGAKTGGETAKVKSVAHDVIVNPAKVCDLLTPVAIEAYLNTAGGNSRAECEKQVRKGKLPTSVKIDVIEVNRDRASVGYRTNQGVTGAMILVKVKGRWLMDQVTTLVG
jgi:hypothetical protein